MAAKRARPDDRAVYVISVVAELAGVHPQTLRMYERKGLLEPQRTSGNSRRYSERDIRQLQRIQELTELGVNLAGVRIILDLEQRLEEAEGRLHRAVQRLEEARQDLANRRWETSRRGVLVRLSDVPDVFEPGGKGTN